jgi:excisionase family DNA binding protein
MLTVKEVSERLRVSDSLVYSWCDEHLLPHYRMGGKGKRGKILIEEAALDAFLESRKVEGKPVDAASRPPAEATVGGQFLPSCTSNRCDPRAQLCDPAGSGAACILPQERCWSWRQQSG